SVTAVTTSTIAAGYGHTCWIGGDATLTCVGENDQGELGIGSSLNELDTPVQAGDAHWLAIASSSDFVCGIQADHTLWCWGDGYHGQLGTGSEDNVLAPQQLPGS